MLRTVRQLLEILDTASRRHFALLLIPMSIMTILEVVSISLILPVIQILIQGKQDGVFTMYIINILPEAGKQNPGPWVIVLFGLFFVIKNILLIALIYTVNRVTAYKRAIFSRRIFDIYLFQPMTFHFHNNSANLLTNVKTGIPQSLETVRTLLMMVLDIMLMVGTCALLIYTAPILTLGVSSIFLIIGLFYHKISSPVFRFWGEAQLDLERTIVKWINQSFNGIRDAKLLQAENYLSRKLGEAELMHSRYRYLITTSIQVPRFLIETVVVVGFLGVVWFLSYVEKNPTEIVSTLGLFGFAAIRLMPSFSKILTSASDLRRSSAYVSTVHEAFSSVKESINLFGNTDTLTSLPFHRKIHLKNITYSYPGAESRALNDIDITINKGQSVGFVGSSGAGKSTLMDIVLGFLKPANGQLLIDDIDAASNMVRWRKNIGFVPQQVFLMDDTIRSNIAFGIEDKNIDESLINKSLKLAWLDEFVSSLPDGILTIVGEHGTRLSGGQRQRIAIARALYRDPEVLVFDEATSALDNETEKNISRAIDRLTGNKTIFIVAHRINTVRNCDVLVFMSNGHVSATGSYQELSSQNHDFRKLCLLEDEQIKEIKTPI